MGGVLYILEGLFGLQMFTVPKVLACPWRCSGARIYPQRINQKGPIKVWVSCNLLRKSGLPPLQGIQQQGVQRISLQIRNEAMVDVSAMATDVSAAPEKAVQDSGDHSCNRDQPKRSHAFASPSCPIPCPSGLASTVTAPSLQRSVKLAPSAGVAS
jgi:hypothetical protein